MLKGIIVLWLVVGSLTAQARPEAACAQPWPAWEAFQSKLISEEGRVIDAFDARMITTSEGQSYAMFFALINNDQRLFHRLFAWTEKNLAQGDLTVNLPAWLWGRLDDGGWGVLDDNSASDSNLWIAYALLEAGRLWDQRDYTLVGHLLLQQIDTHELVSLPGFGETLLPGRSGFAHDRYWRLNPSYLPPQLAWRAQQEFSQSAWSQVAANTSLFLTETSPLGIAPDWVSWTEDGWSFEKADEQIGSYDAIRVYLWVGMLNDDAPDADKLKTHFARALPFIDRDGLPAQTLNVLTGASTDNGPVGFSAALLPLFSKTAFADAQRARIRDVDPSDLGYYSLALLLFGQGWDEGRYTFGPHGQVVPTWLRCQ